MKIYTKTGDQGETGLLTKRVRKTHPKINLIGMMDGLMVHVGELMSIIVEPTIKFDLKKIYRNLFSIQSMIADEEGILGLNLDDDEIVVLENKIDRMDADLKPLTNFIYYSGHPHALKAHHIRVKIREVERQMVGVNENSVLPENILKYMNRLSDYFFVLARYINKIYQVEEETISL